MQPEVSMQGQALFAFETYVREMRMIDTRQFLDTSRRQVIKAVTIGITISRAIVIIILVAFLLSAPSLSLAVLLAITILDTIGGLLVLALVAKRPLWQAV